MSLVLGQHHLLNPFIGGGINPMSGKWWLFSSEAKSQMHLDNAALPHFEQSIVGSARMSEGNQFGSVQRMAVRKLALKFKQKRISLTWSKSFPWLQKLYSRMGHTKHCNASFNFKTWQVPGRPAKVLESGLRTSHSNRSLTVAALIGATLIRSRVAHRF
jgi:hypothetical protein